MRRGKEIAQGAHASMEFLRKKAERFYRMDNDRGSYIVELSQVQTDWLDSGHAKVTLQVDSEAELHKIHQDALAMGLEAHIIVDEGLTEFGGVHTKTALAIGPDYSDKIDMITKHLKLY
jgi:PTH2 family peptidyl-tRNA hydrolase